MGGFLLKRPPSPDDKDHPLNTCTYVPLNETAQQFHERFGTEIYTHFNMTEFHMPIVTGANPTALGSTGRPRPGVDVRIVDENDCELPVDAVGELVVRTDCPGRPATAMREIQRRRRPPGATAGSIPATPFAATPRAIFILSTG